MRAVIFLAIAALVAAAVYAEPYEKTIKFDEEEEWMPLDVNFDSVNASAHLSAIFTGKGKKGKALFVNDENFSKKYGNFTITTIDGASNEMPLEDRVVGVFQFVGVYPETDTCKFELNFEASKGIRNRIAYGVLNPKDFAVIGGAVKNTGSVVSTKDADDPGYVTYMDQSDIGWTVSYDKDTHMVTVTGTSEAYIDFDSGCFDVGVVIVK
jgi:hypothetical protein